MKRSAKITLACGMAIILGLSSTLVFTKAKRVDEHFRKSPNLELTLANWVHVGPEATPVSLDTLKSANSDSLEAQEDGLLLAANDSLSFSVPVSAAGAYRVALVYRPVAQNMLDNVLTASVNGGDALNAIVSTVWIDATTEYYQDSYGNERFPEPKSITDRMVTDYLRMYEEVNKTPMVFQLEAGTANFTVKNISQALVVAGAYIVPVAQVPSYEEYYAKTAAEKTNKLGTDLIIIEGEDYSLKSDSFLGGSAVRSTAVTPYDTYRSVINALNSEAWVAPGKKVLWEFEVKDSGFYKIAVNSSQPDPEGGAANVHREVEIDGRKIFSQMEAIQLPYTGNTGYRMTEFGNDDGAFLFYLEPGLHTIAMTTTTGDMGEKIISDIEAMMEDINRIGMDLKKLSAGSTDRNRTWNMAVYLPEVVPALERFIGEIEALIDKILVYNGSRPSYITDLEYSIRTLEKLLKDQRQIPNRITMLSEGDSSITSSLGGVLSKITRQMVSLDKICIYGENEYKPETSNFFTATGEGLRSFLYSFTPGATKNGAQASYKKSETLRVWVSRPLQYTQILRNIADTDYVDANGNPIPLEISFINDINKLILSNASGTNPDVVIGMQYDKIFDFALRGAALDLTQFDDFLPFYTEHYSWNSLVPVSYDGGIYGAVDTNDLRLMFYRTDIMDALGLGVPQTWDDVQAMLPHLLRYSMNFNLPLSNEVGYKSLDITGSFFFQANGEFYSYDGTQSLINTENSVVGFAQMTDIFNIYGVRQQIPNFFNSFRYSEVPIGIANVDTYLQLQLAAPELAGKWDVALLPGVLQEDGTIARDYPISKTACMIFNNTDKPQQAYDFLKWWLSTDVQVKYAYSLQSTYGPAFYWNPANLDAMAQIYYKPEHLAIMLEQWEHGRENFRHPAAYMLERAISDAWTKVVVQHENKMVSIDYADVVSDREIKRKLVEFGFLDESGNILKEYITDTVDRLKKQQEGQQ